MIAVQFFIFLIVPLLFIGLINRTKAFGQDEEERHFYNRSMISLNC